MKKVKSFKEIRIQSTSGRVLRDLRLQLGLTQTDIAIKMGKSQNAISRIERQEDMSLSTFNSYIQALSGYLTINCEVEK